MTMHKSLVRTNLQSYGHSGGEGVRDSAMAFVEPSSVNDRWELKPEGPLLSSHSKYPGYLGSIFIGVLKNGLPFSVTWAS